MEYLVCYSSFKLEYSKKSCNSMGLDGLCGSGWCTSDARRSTTGTTYRYNGASIHWKTKLQKTISLSTAEAEYNAASTAAVQIIYLRSLLRDWASCLRATRRSSETTTRASDGALAEDDISVNNDVNY
jgi:hypothetical protein